MKHLLGKSGRTAQVKGGSRILALELILAAVNLVNALRFYAFPIATTR